MIELLHCVLPKLFSMQSKPSRPSPTPFFILFEDDELEAPAFGGTKTAQEHASFVQMFSTKDSVQGLHLVNGAGGLGLDLQTADTMVIM